MATRKRIIDKLEVTTELIPPEGWEGGGGGTPGADGKTVLNGAGAPDSGLGVDGDFYIDTTADAIYGPKTAGAWGSPTSLIGPAGATGDTGPEGPEGDAGATGAAGADAIPPAISVTFGDGDNDIVAGAIAYLPKVTAALTITGWTIISDAAGSIVVDVWADTYANAPPSAADTIAGANKPTLSSVQKNQATGLSWAVASGSVMAFKIDSATTVKRVSILFDATSP